MKRIIIFAIFVMTLVTTPSMVFAQPMMSSTGSPSDGHTVREEVEGKEIWEKLQAKQLECRNLTSDNFDSLGEYFMGQMVGGSHEAMNNMMVRMMGEEGEKQMHVAMGKRNSGCNAGFIPMVGMMGGWGGFGISGWLPMLILGVIVLIHYLGNSGRSSDK